MLYKKPATNIVLLKVSQVLLTASTETVDYDSNKHTVLSRNSGSFMDEDDM